MPLLTTPPIIPIPPICPPIVIVGIVAANVGVNGGALNTAAGGGGVNMAADGGGDSSEANWIAVPVRSA